MTGTDREKFSGIIEDVLDRANPFDQFLGELEDQLRTISSDHPGCPIGLGRPIDEGDPRGPIFSDPCGPVPRLYSRECNPKEFVRVSAADFADALGRMRGRIKGAEEQEAFLRMLGLTLIHLRDAEDDGSA